MIPSAAEATRPTTPEERAQAKAIVGFDVDTAARILYFRTRRPLDVGETVVAVSFAQLKSVAGQLVQQEGAAELAGYLVCVNMRAEGTKAVT